MSEPWKRREHCVLRTTQRRQPATRGEPGLGQQWEILTFLRNQFASRLALLALVAGYNLIAYCQLRGLASEDRLTCLLRFFGLSCREKVFSLMGGRRETQTYIGTLVGRPRSIELPVTSTVGHS